MSRPETQTSAMAACWEACGAIQWAGQAANAPVSTDYKGWSPTSRTAVPEKALTLPWRLITCLPPLWHSCQQGTGWGQHIPRRPAATGEAVI